MRDYLFRGKRIDNGEWVKGYYIKATRHWHEHGIHEEWIAVDTIQNGGWCNVRSKYAVIPETVGQYTGLTDKNGKKIFEGDILDGLCGLHIVYFDDSFACFDWKNAIGKQGESFSGFADDYEVIGNIHDNPEILKGGEEECLNT